MAGQELIDRDDEDDDQDWFDRSRRGSGSRGGPRGVPDGPRSMPRRSGGRSSGHFETPTGPGFHPFGHSHLMTPSTPVSAPANLRGNAAISFGRLSAPGSGTDTPTNRAGRGRQNGNEGRRPYEPARVRDNEGGRSLLSRVFGSRDRDSATSRISAPSSGGRRPSESPMTRSRESTPPAAGNDSRKRRRRQPDVDERDWENDWRKDDRLGGAVRDWGREMDREERRAKREHEREQRGPDRTPNRVFGGSQKGRELLQPRLSTGQRYYGGY